MRKPQSVFVQCQLEKHTSKGVLWHVAFIPKQYAIVNQIVKIKDAVGWDDGWKVTQLGVEMVESELPNSHDAIKAHRRASGDSLPKND